MSFQIHALLDLRKYGLLLLALSVLVPVSASGMEVSAYVLHYDGSGSSNLYKIGVTAENTVQEQLVGPTGRIAVGLHITHDGHFYSMDPGYVSVPPGDGSGSRLLELDPSTGSASVVGKLGYILYPQVSMAEGPDGALLLTATIFTDDVVRVFRIDRTTGHASLVALLGPLWMAPIAESSGTIYAWMLSLSTLDPLSCYPSLLGSYQPVDISSLSFDAGGNLWGLKVGSSTKLRLWSAFRFRRDWCKTRFPWTWVPGRISG